MIVVVIVVMAVMRHAEDRKISSTERRIFGERHTTRANARRLNTRFAARAQESFAKIRASRGSLALR